MNVNGSRYHLLLGRDDWRQCSFVGADQSVQLLGPAWDSFAPPVQAVSWDKWKNQLSLAQIDATLPATPTETAYSPEDQRSSVADCNGNIYVIGEDRQTIQVRSRGSGAVSGFWGPATANGRAVAGDFTDSERDTPFAQKLLCLAVSSENYLVAGFAGGFLRFDLVGGGGPEQLAFPVAQASIVPTGLAPASCGGLWLLDGASRTLYRIASDLGFALVPEPAAALALFQPVDALPERLIGGGAVVPIALPVATTPIALAAVDTGDLVILSLEGTGSRLDLVGSDGKLVAPPLAQITRPCFCLAATTDQDGQVIMLADISGNQAHEVRRTQTEGLWKVAIRPDTIPMRRFGGRGLVALGQKVFYDSGLSDPIWVPLQPSKRQVFAQANTIITPVIDSAEPQCVWDRIRIDGCIPTGTAVLIEARAADDKLLIGAGAALGWIAQPRPVLNRDGGELPGKRAIAMTTTDPVAGRGCWDLLLQD
ncbi:MAG: hypothetical protein RL367_1514, partial [Pseudomonadota bacterium]